MNDVLKVPMWKMCKLWYQTYGLLILFYCNIFPIFQLFQEIMYNLLRRKDLSWPGFDPITFTFSENLKNWQERLLEVIKQNIVGWCQQTFCFRKFVDNVQQCFVFTPQANFPAHNLNFHWRWRWWDRIQAIFFFICFLEKIEDSKKAFRNYLTFSLALHQKKVGKPLC